MKYSFLLVFFIVSFFSYAQPCGSNTSNLPTPTKCFEIVSILVDACDGNNEGQNEMIRLKIGGSPLLISGFSVPAFVTGNANWGTGSSNLWKGFCNYNASSLAKIASINTAIANAGRCGKLIPLNNNQSVPANGELLIITSTDFNPTAQSFNNLMDTLYVVLQCSGNTAGHFANYGTSSTRRLILNHTACSDTAIYNRVNLLKQDQTPGADDGGAVNFSYQGQATYVNNGCAIPITPITFDAGIVNPNYCPNQLVNLSGTVTGSNCYFWEAKNKNDGRFSDSSLLNPTFTISSFASGIITLYLKIKNACDQTKDSVSFLVGALSSTMYAGNDTNLCAGTSITLNPVAAGGTVKWYSSKSGTFSNSNQTITAYTPANNELGNTKLILELTGLCGKAYDTININYIAKPNPAFAIPSGQICKGSAPFSLLPVTNGGQFYGSYLMGNTFNPTMDGNFTIKYLIGISGCADSSYQVISVTKVPDPNFTIPVASICAGSQAILLTPSVIGGVFSGTGVIGNTFNPSAGGNYTIKYHIQNGVCKDSSSRIIQVFPKPNPNFTIEDTLFCEGDLPVNLTPVEQGGIFASNNTSLSNARFSPSKAGLYFIKHKIVKGTCADSSQITLRVIENPSSNFSYLPKFAIVNEAILFTYTGMGATHFEWKFGNPILGTSTLQNPSFSFSKSGEFLVKLIAKNEICSAENIQEIVIDDADTLFVPNVFTPNGDFLNDSFGAIGHGIKEYNMLIFNRWGDLLYTSSHIDHKWDGTYHEKDCPDGVYFFIITALSNIGRNYNISSTLHLIR